VVPAGRPVGFLGRRCLVRPRRLARFLRPVGRHRSIRPGSPAVDIADGPANDTADDIGTEATIAILPVAIGG